MQSFPEFLGAAIVGLVMLSVWPLMYLRYVKGDKRGPLALWRDWQERKEL